MQRIALSVLFLTSALVGCPTPSSDNETESGRLPLQASCGAERWDVKTGGDLDSSAVDLNPRQASITELIHFPRPSALPHRRRVGVHELQTYKLTDVLLLKYKVETDSDYHLVVSDGDWTMIAEIPMPGCVPPTSPFATAIHHSRATFDSRFVPGDRFQRAYTSVTVTGVGFFDFLHDQTGGALNGFELHPVLDLCFGTGCSLAAPSRVNETPSPGCNCDLGHPTGSDLWIASIACLRWMAVRRARKRAGGG